MTLVWLAFRRMRARPLVVAAIGFALAGTGALVGWSSLRAEVAQERSARVRLAEVPPERRALQVVHHLVPDQADLASGKVEAFFRRFARVTAASRLVVGVHHADQHRPGLDGAAHVVGVHDAAAVDRHNGQAVPQGPLR